MRSEKLTKEERQREEWSVEDRMGDDAHRMLHRWVIRSHQHADAAPQRVTTSRVGSTLDRSTQQHLPPSHRTMHFNKLLHTITVPEYTYIRKTTGISPYTLIRCVYVHPLVAEQMQV